MESIDIFLIAVLVLLCIGFICMYIIFIKFIRDILIEIANKIKSIDGKIDYIDTKLNLVDNKIQELNKIIYSIYDNHIKVIENYTKYCATSIARKHKSNKNKTNTKQQ